VLVEAVPPNEPTLPNPFLILGATGICALGAGFWVVRRKELRAQQTVLSIDEVSRRGLRSLGLIPEDHGVERSHSGGVALVTSDPAHVFSASVTSLQAAISTLPGLRSEGGRVLLLTSALPAEGKSTTAAALATSMATSGYRVLLVDADLRSPTLHRSFDLPPGPGLAECVGSDASLEPAIRKDPATGVHVLAAGDAQGRPLGVLGSPRLRALLKLWRTQFDTILVDSPPILAAGDVRMLAQLSDDVIVVARWGSTTWSSLTHAARTLEESGARLAGVAVSRVDVRQLSSYDYADAHIYDVVYGRSP
jgi:succinoglycan biosynthesis transport protein ExoP